MPSKAYPNGVSTAYPSRKTVSLRRSPLFITLITAFVCLTIFFSSSSVQDLSTSAKDVAKNIPRPSISRPKLSNFQSYNPFRQSSHEPPLQKNSTVGEIKWYSNWKWLSSFSSTITLDESRSVLPPLVPRPPIYTYYDPEIERPEEVRKAEKNLLVIWRRAWWAQGFKPVILSRAEAMNNPLYETLQGQKYGSALETSIMHWLAWSRMGSGIFANWLVLPMGPYDDHLLSYLRRGSYPKLTQYEGLSNGLFSGDKASVETAITTALKSSSLNTSDSVFAIISDPKFRLLSRSPKPKSIAFYEASILRSQYQSIADALLTDQAQGLNSLAQLITAHLHTTFLNIYTSGLAVVTPHALHSAVLSIPALQLAHVLNTCSASPLPQTCPPNNSQCTPCKSLPLSYWSSYTNTSALFTIGTTPHPYTLSVLRAKKLDLLARYIRRETDRDPWLQLVTQKTLGKALGGMGRIVNFKEEVDSDSGSLRGIWTTAENDWQWRDLEWYFGFELPQPANSTSTVPSVIDPAYLDPLLKATHAHGLSADELKAQSLLAAKAKQRLRRDYPRPSKAKYDITEVVEAWNMADTEAWRFVRAYSARQRVERAKWEEEEKRFVGGEEGGRRWFDRS